MGKPLFVIKKNLQKSAVTNVYFSDLLTDNILKDVCFRLTGKEEYDVNFVDNNYTDEYLEPTYNKGRLGLLFYNDTVHYISFSEKNVEGRNSSVQSVSTAFNIFYNSPATNKKLYFYFLNNNGGFEVPYLMLIYKLMRTIGFSLLNESLAIRDNTKAFSSIEEIMNLRAYNSSKNRSNNSTYVTKSARNTYDIYGKTYGANKYETALICYAVSLLSKPNHKINLYEVTEGDLCELPSSCLSVIRAMGIINVIPTDLQLEKRLFSSEDSLRSPRYLYNLLDKLGHKHCAFCGCEISEIIQGAHIWPVSEIKKYKHLNNEEKLQCAIDGENGIWLCENHHKLFDSNIIGINKEGKLVVNTEVPEYKTYIDEITKTDSIPDRIFTDKFKHYLKLRNSALQNDY